MTHPTITMRPEDLALIEDPQIKGVGARDGMLYVLFKGASLYCYWSMDPEADDVTRHADMMRADEAPYRYFNANVRKPYQYRRIWPDEWTKLPITVKP